MGLAVTSPDDDGDTLAVQQMRLTPIEEAEQDRQADRAYEAIPTEPDVLPQAQEWSERLPARWMLKYCMAMATLGTHGAAILRARISTDTVDRHKESCPAFAKAVKEAQAIAHDGLEAGLTISATVGDMEPIYQSGCLVGYKRVKSVKAAELLLTAYRPERYRKGDAGPTVNTTLVLQSQDAVADAVRAALASGALGGRAIEAKAVEQSEVKPPTE